MTKREFANKVAEMVNGTVNEVEKANGIVYTGITINNGQTVRPNIYIDQAYKDGKTVEEAADEVIRLTEEYSTNKFEVITNDFMSYDTIKGTFRARLYNNKTKADVYKSAAEYGFEDLIIVPACQLSENASIRINASHLKNWGVTAEEVINTAIENSVKEGFVIKSMVSMLAKMMGQSEEDLIAMGMVDDGKMDIITNESAMFGAFGVIAMKDELEKRFPDGYIVLPSSVHEVIVVPADMGNENDLTEMVQSVNASEVSPEEVLGDRVYMFAA